MEKSTLDKKRLMAQLERAISDLEWDIPRLVNKDVKNRKIEALKLCKQRLRMLKSRTRAALAE